jgi:hypothetical protein
VSSRDSRPRVLALADVRGSLVAACRVAAPLQALADAGLIAGFKIADATLRGVPRSEMFDVVWLQRAADAWLARAVAERLDGRFLLDMDDHLLCRPAYLDDADMPDPLALKAALASCAVLTTPSAKLRGLLELRSGLALAGRAFLCPNAVPFGPRPVRPAHRPAAVLLTQGHRLALAASRDEVLAAIAEAAERHRLPLWSLGDADPALRSAVAAAGGRLQHLRPRSWTEYHAALAGRPSLLGVAPLETRGDIATVEFTSGKSDVKMVEFGGYGHPAVYSDAAPYADSDLACGRLVANRHEDWTAAVDELMNGGWRAAAEEALSVRTRRDMTRVAREHWWPAVQAARLQQPLEAGRLFGELERLGARARDRVARARWRLRWAG